MSLHAMLIASRLTGSDGLAAHRRLRQQARALSRGGRLTGALLFDGEQALLMIEGDAAEVGQAFGLLYGSEVGGSGSSACQVLAEQPIDQRRLQRWCAGYAEPDQLDALRTGSGLTGAALLTAFVALLQHCECD